MLARKFKQEQPMSPQKLTILTLCGSLALSVLGAHSQEQTAEKIDNPDEVRQLIVDKALDGKYWTFYFRSDGKMAYEQGGFTSIREWKINADGAICMNIYSMPDKSLGCETFSRTVGQPTEYWLEGKTGKAKVQIVEPDQAIVEAVSEKAGEVD